MGGIAAGTGGRPRKRSVAAVGRSTIPGTAALAQVELARPGMVSEGAGRGAAMGSTRHAPLAADSSAHFRGGAGQVRRDGQWRLDHPRGTLEEFVRP